MTEQESLGRYHAALASGLSDYEAREDGWPTAAVTPREVLDDRFDSDHVAITALAALSAAGYEVLPTALVDAAQHAGCSGGRLWHSDACVALAAYRAPVLLGQTEETP